jgi:hypothetical protein
MEVEVAQNDLDLAGGCWSRREHDLSGWVVVWGLDQTRERAQKGSSHSRVSD